MKRIVLLCVACLSLAACGAGETAISSAAGGASEAAQAKEAKQTEARIRQQLDAAAAVDAQRRDASEAGSQ
jgi:hypothetical protein